MAAFSYIALDAKGKKVKGVLEADSERGVRTQLRNRQLKALEVKSSRNTIPGASNSGSFLASFSAPKMKARDVSLVTRQLASLVQSGLPIDEVLQSTAKQSRKPAVKAIVLQIRSRVLEGLSLTKAMGEVPKVFDGLYRAMIHAGESSGYLGPVLEQLADYTETAQDTTQKVKSAMVYPIVMVVFSILVVTLLMVKVVPKMVGMFKRNGADLPGLTKFMIGASDFLINYGIFVVFAVVAAVMLFNIALKDTRRRKNWHRLLLRAPMFGNFILQGETARYANTLGLLVTSGVPLVESLKIASQVLTNLVLKDASRDVAIAVQEGSSLNKALDQVIVFPPLLVQMAASGEANGKLADQLLHTARNQERELEYSLSAFLSLLQPLMIIFMGGMVVTIVMAIMLPIFKMSQLVS